MTRETLNKSFMSRIADKIAMIARRATNVSCLALAAAVLAGCVSGRAPVMESKAAARSAATQNPRLVREAVSHSADWRPQTYIVQKGDTLYGIAFNYGFDYHELAELNGIQNPDLIKVGQEIRLFPAATATPPAKPAPPPEPVVASAVESNPVVETAPVEIPVISQPLVVKLPYSEKAVAQIEKMQQQKPVAVAAAPKAKPAPAPKAEPVPVAQTRPVPPPAVAAALESDGEVAWAMPVSGKLVAGFSESDNRKGIDLAGKLGQPVLASAAGKVVYSGSGLRGYGKLVIIKHNRTYLSAYAHNDKILVKEGDIVTQGQKIAEMGNTDADRVELHFEIRKLGKPVDPAQYLPQIKS
jgi:lipoprotein NlpD